MIRHATMVLIAVLMVLAAAASKADAQSQRCHREGVDVICDDGRHGIWSGDAVVWADGTRSHSSPHPSVVIGNKPSVRIGQGVFVGQGKGMTPLDDPNKVPCVTLDEVPYCY